MTRAYIIGLLSNKLNFSNFKDRGGNQVVSMLVFFSDNPSLNPTEAYSLFFKSVLEKNKNDHYIIFS